MMKNIKLMIVDDEKTKMSLLCKHIDYVINNNFSDYTVTFEKVLLVDSSEEELVDKIYTDKIDVIILDYAFTNSNVPFNGVRLAKYISDRVPEFPTFILTNYQDEIYQKESYDTYNVFDVERIIKEENERIEFVKKIIYQTMISEKKIDEMKEYIMKNSSFADNTINVDSKLIQYDTTLEKRFGEGNGIDSTVKKTILERMDKVNDLIARIDELIKE